MSPRAASGFLALVLALVLAGCGSSGPAPVEDRMAAAVASAPVVGRLKDGSLAVRVGRGDTAYGVARRYGVSVRALIERNNLKPPYLLRVGQVLAVPEPQLYVVKKGDTLYAIAKRHGVDLNALIRINGVRPPYIIHVGQRLRLPDRWDQSRTAVRAEPPAPKEERWTPGRNDTEAQPTQTARRAPPRRPPPASLQAPPGREGGFIWPVRGKIISRFGSVGRGLRNDGINIQVPRGTAVVAAETGIVAYAGNEVRGFGNLLLIKHDGGWMTAYAHLDQMLVKRGDKVRRGQAIGKVGSTGNVKTPQLHFELRRRTQAVDPLKHLSTATAMLPSD